MLRSDSPGSDDAIGPDGAAGHIEAAHARRLERGQGAHDPREQCGASLGQRAESARGGGREDGGHEPEDDRGRQQMGGAGEGIRGATAGGGREGQAREAGLQRASVGTRNPDEVRVFFSV